MMAPTATVKYVILMALFNGRWVETTYEVADPRWKEAIKLFRDVGTKVKMVYKS